MPNCSVLFTMAENALMLSQFEQLKEETPRHAECHPAAQRFHDLYMSRPEVDIAEVQRYNIRVAIRTIMNARLSAYSE